MTGQDAVTESIEVSTIGTLSVDDHTEPAPAIGTTPPGSTASDNCTDASPSGEPIGEAGDVGDLAMPSLDQEHVAEDDQLEALDPLSRYGLTTRGGAVLTKDLQPVCTFLIQSVRSGTIQYPNGREEPLHEVTVVLARGGDCVLEVRGDLYDVRNWTEAEGSGTSIINPAKFAQYMFQRLERDGVQRLDPDLCRSHLVGTFRDGSGRLRVSYGHPDIHDALSLYSRVELPRTGDRRVFDLVAALSRGDAVRATLVHGLGGVFKPALGSRYPHLKLEGSTESGKTTLLEDCLGPRFGFVLVDAQSQCDTGYRQKAMLSGANLPVYADEVGRVKNVPARKLMDILNVAYGTGRSSHGAGGKAFQLEAPFVGTGQDWNITDEALLSKILVFELRKEEKDLEALAALRQQTQCFPTGEWMEWVCAYATERDLAAMADERAALLVGRVPDNLQRAGAESGRCVWNYATQLVVADALVEYGVSANIEEYIVERLIAHLRLLCEEGRTVAERFVDDLMTIMARHNAPNALLHTVTQDGVYVHVESALKVLKQAGYVYDITDPRMMTKLLRTEGIVEAGADRRHYFNGVRRRAVLIAHERLHALGHNIDLGEE